MCFNWETHASLLRFKTDISVSDAPDTKLSTVEAALAMLEPLAGLLLTRELPYADAEDLLKMAYVHASARAFVAQGKLPSVSNLSVATGIRRREVKRLLETPLKAAARKPSVASQARLRWATDPAYLDESGQPRPLARSAPGKQVSFTTLASSVSKDMHPRALLDELLRIGAVEENDDQVTLLQTDYRPPQAEDELIRIAGANVGDHLSAALMNVLSNPPPLVERAIFLDGLTQASARQGTELTRGVWRDLLQGLRSKLQTLSDADAHAPQNNWRMRIGLYTYFAPEERLPVPVAPPPKRTARKTPDKLAKVPSRKRATSTVPATRKLKSSEN